jgi:hypothetical protein
MKYNLELYSDNGTLTYSDSVLTFIAESDSDNAQYGMKFDFSDWEDDAYIFMPACAYNGNRFKKLYVKYPPMYTEDTMGINPEPIITDLPALNPDGSGSIEVTSGDLATPLIAVYYRHKKEAIFIFTEQECKDKNIGYTVENGKIEIKFPTMRSVSYRMARTNEPSGDTGIFVKKGEKISSRVIINSIPCQTLMDFYQYFFENRKLLLDHKPCENMYTDELWNIMEEHLNRDNYTGEYYFVGKAGVWQCGWVGGSLATAPLFKLGTQNSKKRCENTLDFMSKNVSKFGFFYSPISLNGENTFDGGGKPNMPNAMLTRKNGDALCYLIKNFELTKPRKNWIKAAKNCADAFIKVYDRYGELGHFINIETGEMLAGGTASGATVITALLRAGVYFGEKRYIDVAKALGEDYYRRFVEKGLIYGGPRETLCAPDSESSYAMLEALISLYELDNDEKWLSYAKDALHIFSSYVMSYTYRFPLGCEFARLNINTVGSVFASVQNKHSSPGIATSSGEAIYKVYKYTKNEKYLELLRDIVRFIPQCVSTEEKPIYARDNSALLPGWICERVNTSDWENYDCIGTVFNVPCWPQTSLMLSFSELIADEKINSKLNPQ